MESFSIFYHHGGRFASIGGETVYFGGEILGKYSLDADRIGYLDLVDEMEKLGYSQVKLSYRVPGRSLDDGLREMKDDKEVVEMVNLLTPDEAMVHVYVQGVKNGPGDSVVPHVPCKRTSEGEEIRATPRDSGGSINRKRNGKEAEKPADLDKGEEDEDGLEEDGSCAEDSNTDGELPAGEDDIENAEDEGSDVNEEDIAARKELRKYRQSRPKRQTTSVEKDHIELGEAGVDIGYNEAGSSRQKKYDGKVGGDEKYFDSDDAGSDMSDNERTNDDEVPERRQSIRVEYDPTCHIPLWEIGLVFENAVQFREALAKYVVLRGVELKLRPNESGRVRAKCKWVGCKWFISGSIDGNTKDFTVKTYNPTHSCWRTNRNKLCTLKFIVNYYKERIIS